jgi:predicted HTH transcriptional regulator
MSHEITPFEAIRRTNSAGHEYWSSRDFARIRAAMLNHGLDAPMLGQQDGFFVVTLRGPAGHYDRLKVPAGATGPITPAIESQLNERQKLIMTHVFSGESVTRGWCVTKFDVANDTAGRDLKGLTKLGLIEPQGRGRAVRYVVKATDNRPAHT